MMSERVIALAGNPNVGKSTVFNALTGLRQHTGNWTGKTVSLARGEFSYGDERFVIYDIPGTYSLAPRSREETTARDFLCFGGADMCIAVCDACALERNLFLALQIAETGLPVIICVNLLDEAKKRGIYVDLNLLGHELRMPVCGTSARSGSGINELIKTATEFSEYEKCYVSYPTETENAVEIVSAALAAIDTRGLSKRWIALRLIESDGDFAERLGEYLGIDVFNNEKISSALEYVRSTLSSRGIDAETFAGKNAKAIYDKAHSAAAAAVICAGKSSRFERELKIDRFVTGKFTSFLVLFVLLAAVFYITVVGANYPTQWLTAFFDILQQKLYSFSAAMGMPAVLREVLLSGGVRVLSWVVCVMMPPMAIFFPCFTLLEDSGLLPRVSYVLDSGFQRAGASGKQSLCICMGFGCNCVGVEGARIIDSKRERLIAIITNSFTPCNGRFPAIIKLIGIFVLSGRDGAAGAFFTALCLAGVIVFSLAVTLAVSNFLSRFCLRGEPSHYILELPPYRAPQWGKVMVRSVFDRTLFVLGRAAAIAFPAGIVIGLLANVKSGDVTLLLRLNALLEKPGAFIGLDGETLTAFILGLPANEIVLPLALMSYSGSSALSDSFTVTQIGTILFENGWTAATALCYTVFTLLHFPCSTTIITIYKETKSVKMTVLSMLIPLTCGVLCCAALRIIL